MKCCLSSTPPLNADSRHNMKSLRNFTRSIMPKALRFSTSLATSLPSRPQARMIASMKIKVNGDDAAPLYKFLKEQKGFAGWDETHPIYPILEKMLSEADPDYKQKADIKWNFTKFLVNKKGQVVKRYEPTEKIEHIVSDIEELLK